jgi:hypothetical protein
MGGGAFLAPVVGGLTIAGVSLTMGEYWEMEEAPLKAPGGGAARRDGACTRLLRLLLLGEGSRKRKADGGG